MSLNVKESRAKLSPTQNIIKLFLGYILVDNSDLGTGLQGTSLKAVYKYFAGAMSRRSSGKFVPKTGT